MVFFVEPIEFIVTSLPNSPIPASLLDRYLADECTPEEKTDVENWLHVSPDRSALLHELHRAGYATSASWNIQAALTAVQQRTASSRNYGVRRPARRSGWGIAAAVACAVLLGIGLFTYQTRSTSSPVSATGTTYVTGNGERVHHKLPDGTMVSMNAASRLDIPDGYGTTHRTLRLTGEAYFEVIPSSSLPFVIQAADASVRVLGTEFSVRAYDRNDLQVAVRSGRVALQNVVLGANDVARMMASGYIQVTQRQNSDEVFGFTRGWLALNNVPLRHSIPDLNRWYDADIRLGDPRLGDQLLYATLPSGSIDDLAEALRTIFNVKVVVAGRTVTLYSR